MKRLLKNGSPERSSPKKWLILKVSDLGSFHVEAAKCSQHRNAVRHSSCPSATYGLESKRGAVGGARLEYIWASIINEGNVRRTQLIINCLWCAPSDCQDQPRRGKKSQKVAFDFLFINFSFQCVALKCNSPLDLSGFFPTFYECTVYPKNATIWPAMKKSCCLRRCHVHVYSKETERNAAEEPRDEKKRKDLQRFFYCFFIF